MPPVSRVLDIKIFGDQIVRRKLFRGAAVAGNMRPGLELVADDMMKVIRTNFESQGRRGGGAWKGLKPKTLQAKLKRGEGARILIASGALMDSMTVRGDPEQKLRVTGKSIELGSYLKDAPVHQRGNENIPARPFIKFLPTDRVRWTKIVQTTLLEAMRVA